MRPPAKLALALALLALVFLAGCGVISKLRARDELNKGVRAYKGAQFETSIEHFKRAIELDPDLLNARIYLAIAYASQFVPGSPSEENKELARKAIEEFERVLEKDPNNLVALGYIASLYYGLGGGEKTLDGIRANFDKSKEFRRKLIEIDAQNPEHYYSIGVLDWALCHRANEETRLANRVSRPDEPLPARVRKELAEKNGPLVEEGIQMLEKAIEINPKYVDAIAYLNLIYRQRADIAETPQEREHYLDLADQMFDRQKRIREEAQGAPAGAR